MLRSLGVNELQRPVETSTITVFQRWIGRTPAAWLVAPTAALVIFSVAWKLSSTGSNLGLVIPSGVSNHVGSVELVRLGDMARTAGDYHAALKHYRAAGDSGRLAVLQGDVEYDAERRMSTPMSTGHYAEALNVVDAALVYFPSSQRLKALRASIERARDS